MIGVQEQGEPHRQKSQRAQEGNKTASTNVARKNLTAPYKPAYLLTSKICTDVFP